MDPRSALPTRRRPAPVLLAAVLTGALLAGCTGDPAPPTSTGPTSSATTAGSSPTGADSSSTDTAPSVADVYRAVRTASLSEESGRAVGTVTSDGAKLRIDLEGQANGDNQTVFITTPASTSFAPM